MSNAPADLERFCATEFPRLVRMLDLLTGDVHVAEELAQEALVRASSHWAKVSRLDAPGAWTRRVARNLATSRWRRTQAARRAAARVGPDPTVHHDTDMAEVDAVHVALQRLSARDREVLVLRHHLELTVAETADELDITHEAVRSRSHRAAARLRALLAPLRRRHRGGPPMNNRDRTRPGDDLTSLLRDAGREATLDLDVDDVHRRGRRRATGRRVAVGLGTLVVAGAVAIGVTALTPDPVPFVGDADPSEPTADRPAPTEADRPRAEPDSDHAGDRRVPTMAMADLGVTVVDVTRSSDGAGGLGLRVVTPEGVVDEFATAAGALPPLGSHVVVDPQRNVWFNDVDPNLLVGGSDDPVGRPFLRARDGVGWIVLGTAASGQPLVAQGVGEDGQLAEPDPSVQVIQEVTSDSDPVGESGALTGIPGINIRDSLGDELPFAAAAVAEHLAVLSGAGESQTATWHQAGGDSVVLAEIGGLDSWFVDLTIVEDEVWIVANEDGATNIWIAPTQGGAVRHLATPLGRAREGFVTDIQAESGPDGPVVVMSTASSDEENGPAYAVDVEAARDGAAEASVAADADVPPGVYDVLDAQGQVHLLPLSSTTVAASDAACANDEDARVNEEPAFGGALFFLCSVANDQLGEGVGYPFVATERLTGGVQRTPDEAGLLTLLRTWQDGPTEVEEEAGLEPVLGPAQGTIEGVTVDGTEVTVDVAAGPQVGNLGTSYGSGAVTTAVVGMVLQYDGFETVRFTLDGSCEAWGGLVQAGGCPTYDETHTPWQQGGHSTSAACSTDSDVTFNEPPAADIAMWFTCPAAAGSSDVAGVHRYVRIDDRFAAATVVDSIGGVGLAVATWFEGPTADEQGAGLAGGVGPDVVSLIDVRLQDTTVVIDLEAGPQVGVLGTTTGGATFVQPLAGVVLQFDGYGQLEIDRVQFRLDGSCEDWAAVVRSETDDATSCPTYDESHAPWTPGG